MTLEVGALTLDSTYADPNRGRQHLLDSKASELQQYHLWICDAKESPKSQWKSHLAGCWDTKVDATQ